MSASETPSVESSLVIGGCGLLGHHIVKKLLESNDNIKVAALDINTDRNRIDGVEYINGNITSREVIQRVISEHRPQVVFHTVSPGALSGNRKRFFDVNVKGTENLLECLKTHSCVKALVYTSSSSVIHSGFSDLNNVTEDLPLFFEPDQKSYYSHTKAMAERMILDANRKHGFLTTSIRPAVLFGEGDIVLTGNMAGLGARNLIIGRGENKFDFTYVGNNAYAQVLAAQALLRASNLPDTIDPSHRVEGEAFVITNDDPWPFWEFSRALAVAAGYTVDRSKVRKIPKALVLFLVGIWEWLFMILTLGSRQPGITRQSMVLSTLERTFDIRKAKTRLGYVPQVSMEEGVDRTISWYMAQQTGDVKKHA
jgi:sterol-4alpha-carboxylate 3-dehydrogenase (decarboxylating)